MAQAYLVVGDVRGEAMEFARSALAVLFGAAGGGKRPNASNPDILEIEPQKKSRIISIEQVREAVKRMAQTSFAGGWKACIIVAADRLGQDAANAFLKTLEEPSGRCVFFLLTDRPDSLLPTVLSRCVRVSLSEGGSPLPGEWREKLIGILSASDAGVQLNDVATSGRIRRLFEEMKEAVEERVKDDAPDGLDKDTFEARVGSAFREIRGAALRLVMMWHRDVMVWVFDPGGAPLLIPEAAEHTRRQASATSAADALGNIAAVEMMREELEQNFDEWTVLSAGFARMGAHRVPAGRKR